VRAAKQIAFRYNGDPTTEEIELDRRTILSGLNYLMPAPEQRVVNSPCGAKLLLRWTWSLGSVIYPVRCPDRGAEHQLHATPPIEVYRLDFKGNWEYVTRICSEPT
jgi:hypothetical protein